MIALCNLCRKRFYYDDDARPNEGFPNSTPPKCYLCAAKRLLKSMLAGEKVSLCLHRHKDEWWVTYWPTTHVTFKPARVRFVTVPGGEFKRRPEGWRHMRDPKASTYTRYGHRYLIVRFRFDGRWWTGRVGDRFLRQPRRDAESDQRLPVTFGVNFKRTKKWASESDLVRTPPGLEHLLPTKVIRARKRADSRKRRASNLGVPRAEQAQAGR